MIFIVFALCCLCLALFVGLLVIVFFSFPLFAPYAQYSPLVAFVLSGVACSVYTHLCYLELRKYPKKGGN